VENMRILRNFLNAKTKQIISTIKKKDDFGSAQSPEKVIKGVTSAPLSYRKKYKLLSVLNCC